MARITDDDYKWKPCQQPCHFLLERSYDSDISGIPAGVERRCTHSIWRALARLREVHLSTLKQLKKVAEIAEGHPIRWPW